ncbi:hypothetical protein FRC08_001921 [Ceratobasidium sp. 394]|nr:hypothetical protein FRC08_001921 [Ceratobasidium sp. 394]
MIDTHTLELQWVCRNWRLAALGTTQIWAFIDLSDYLLKRITLYIARSGSSQPLDIYLNVTRRFLRGLLRRDEAAQTDRVESALSSVIAAGGSTNRWRTFNIKFSAPAVPTAYLLILLREEKFPRMESLTIISHHKPDPLRLQLERANDPPILLEVNAPKLHSIHFRGFSMNYFSQQIGASIFSQLVCLELGCLDKSPSLSNLCLLLERNPRLQVLRLSLGTQGAGYSWDPSRSGLSVSLPLLEEPSLNNCRSALWARELLLMIEARNVRKFRLVISRIHTGHCNDLVTSIVSGKHNYPVFPQVYHLSTNLPTVHLEVLLRVYPDLQRLDLLPGHDMGSVTILSHAPWLVCHLTRLWVTEDDVPDSSPFDELVRVRKEAGISIPNIQLGWMGYAAYFT